MYWGRWLWVSEFFEDNAYDLSFLCIEKQCTKFSFGGRCSNKFENCAGDVDRAIDDDWFSISWNAA
jgi:hypothetical protein